MSRKKLNAAGTQSRPRQSKIAIARCPPSDSANRTATQPRATWEGNRLPCPLHRHGPAGPPSPQHRSPTSMPVHSSPDYTRSTRLVNHHQEQRLRPPPSAVHLPPHRIGAADSTPAHPPHRKPDPHSFLQPLLAAACTRGSSAFQEAKRTRSEIEPGEVQPGAAPGPLADPDQRTGPRRCSEGWHALARRKSRRAGCLQQTGPQARWRLFPRRPSLQPLPKFHVIHSPRTLARLMPERPPVSHPPAPTHPASVAAPTARSAAAT